MAKVPLLATGIKGLVGSKLMSSFADHYSFESLDISDPVQPVDITNAAQVLESFQKSTAQAVVHFAAFTDVNAAWQQKGDQSGLTYQVNVVGTENIIKAAEQTQKHLIHISTAYVFDGEKTTPYTEEDQPRALEWYGETKLLAEERVKAAQTPWTIFRIDQPFRSDAFARPDIVHKIVAGITSGKLYPQFTNHFFGPTFIDDFVKVIDWAVRTQSTGLFHATSGEQWSDFDFASLVNDTLQLHGEIKPGNLDEYLKTIQRPYQRNTALDTSKLEAVLDFPLRSVKEAVAQVTL
jgi:dTDP-4-dehydrorhamnose reductase